MNSNYNPNRITDIITPNTVTTWKDNDVITIKAPCGRGKSYFIKNTLYNYAKENGYKILFLIHRNNCKDQFIKELERDNKTDIIEIVSYQKIETKLKHSKPFNLSAYKYVICDEFHYFVSDTFNKYTDLSYNHILNAPNSIKIFMSATGDFMTKYINNQSKVNTIDYEIEQDFSFIKKLEFYYSDDVLENYIEQAYKNKQKTLLFLSLENAKKYYLKYKDNSLFNCSKSKKEYKYVNEDRIQEMLEHEKFECLFMFTTTVMDAGLNIIDDELTNIVIDVGIDMDTIIQCIGRKRLTKTSHTVNVLMKAYSNKRLGGFETYYNKAIEQADYFNNNSLDAYMMKYYRQYDKHQIVYDDINSFNGTDKKINMLRYHKVMYEISRIQLIKSYSKYNNYCVYVSDYFNLKYTIKDNETMDKNLEEYLKHLHENEIRIVKEISDKLSDKYEYELQQDLVNMINLTVNGKQMKTVKTLNTGLDMLGFPYGISQFRSNGVTYWVVGEIEN